jgi:hypothetical protein
MLQVLKVDSIQAASVLNDQLYDEIEDEVEFGDRLYSFRYIEFWW